MGTHDGNEKTKRALKIQKDTNRLKSSKTNKPTHIIGIGASAGGLEAIEAFFRNMPNDSGLAFVVVQHLSPDFKSMMEELMTRYTEMEIHRVQDGMEVKANAVYLIPPKKEMIIEKGRLQVKDREFSQNLNLPIDIFLNSLAIDKKDKAVAIILSGTGSDGSRGVKSVHDKGGLVIVQSEDSAKFDGMPKNAIATNFADLILNPTEMPEILMLYANGMMDKEYIAKKKNIIYSSHSIYNDIFTLLYQSYGIDFTLYKPATVGRRIERRLAMDNFSSLDSYIKRLETDKEELDSLYRDLLIGVTTFFRDKEAFQLLDTKIIPEIMKKVAHDEDIRVWIPGCATGEEAYSLAILFKEHMLKAGRKNNVKLFATDAHKYSLEKAALGIFHSDAVQNVSKQLLKKYFKKSDEHYKICTDIRKMVVFAEHNVIKDPPFTKIDLISCRNLLIYLRAATQHKILTYFHFALKTNGKLFLGPSETLGNLEKEFIPIDTHWKIYKKRRDIRLTDETNFTRTPTSRTDKQYGIITKSVRGQVDLRISRAYENLLQTYVPPSLLVDEDRQLIHSFGSARDFLKPAAGRIDLDILSMVEGDLRIGIASALQKSKREMKKVTYKGIKYKREQDEKVLQITVEPQVDKTSKTDYYLVIIEEVVQEKVKRIDLGLPGDKNFQLSYEAQNRIHDLELELQYSKEHLQSTVEELETSNEELQATNEELLASNEELQSTNEELHSVNEELYTVNGEYERKIDELTQLKEDIDNLMDSTQIGTIFLDMDLKIRKFTPSITENYNLIPQDIDRPITHIASNIRNHQDLADKAKQVLETGEVVEVEVLNNANRYYLERILPYRDDNNEIKGTVISYLDITAAKTANLELIKNKDRLQLALNTLRAGIWEWDLRETYRWDDNMERMFGFHEGKYKGDFQGWFSKIHSEDSAKVERALHKAVEESGKLDIIFRMRPNEDSIWFYTRIIGKLNDLDKTAPPTMIGLCYYVSSYMQNEHTQYLIF